VTLLLISTDQEGAEICLAADRSECREGETTVRSNEVDKIFAIRNKDGLCSFGVGFAGSLNIIEPGQSIASPLPWLAREAVALGKTCTVFTEFSPRLATALNARIASQTPPPARQDNPGALVAVGFVNHKPLCLRIDIKPRKDGSWPPEITERQFELPLAHCTVDGVFTATFTSHVSGARAPEFLTGPLRQVAEWIGQPCVSTSPDHTNVLCLARS
jgi:hypothetical protein